MSPTNDPPTKSSTPELTDEPGSTELLESAGDAAFPESAGGAERSERPKSAGGAERADGAERAEHAFGFTPAEATALAALAAGLSTLTTGLAGRPLPVSEEDAVIAAIEHALSRMIDDYEVPDPTIRAQVTTARDNLRTHWTRGAASM